MSRGQTSASSRHALKALSAQQQKTAASAEAARARIGGLIEGLSGMQIKFNEQLRNAQEAAEATNTQLRFELESAQTALRDARE